MHAVKMLTTFAAAALVAAAPSPGHAADGEEADWGPSGLGAYFLVGGGASGFSDRALRDRVDTGGSWDARVGVGRRWFVGAEAAYVGSLRDFKGTSDTKLAMNGLEAVARLQVPVASGAWTVTPFAFGGIGWTHTYLRSPGPGVSRTDDVGTVPFGAGLTVGYRRVLLDARFTYRTTFNDRVALAPGATADDLSNWNVGASLGFAF